MTNDQAITNTQFSNRELGIGRLGIPCALDVGNLESNVKLLPQHTLTPRQPLLLLQ